MVLVPAGEFVMGSGAFEWLRLSSGGGAWKLHPFPDERPRRTVQLDAYWIDRTEVTNEQYEKFVADDGYENMSLWDTAIWPAVLDFVDRTGHPGPPRAVRRASRTSRTAPCAEDAAPRRSRAAAITGAAAAVLRVASCALSPLMRV